MTGKVSPHFRKPMVMASLVFMRGGALMRPSRRRRLRSRTCAKGQNPARSLRLLAKHPGWFFGRLVPAGEAIE